MKSLRDIGLCSRESPPTGGKLRPVDPPTWGSTNCWWCLGGPAYTLRVSVDCWLGCSKERPYIPTAGLPQGPMDYELPSLGRRAPGCWCAGVETTHGPHPSEERTRSKIPPESQGQNLALTVLYVPHSLDSGLAEGRLSPPRSRNRMVEYDLFIKSQLACTQLTLAPYYL